jgi:hypothetical protein
LTDWSACVAALHRTETRPRKYQYVAFTSLLPCAFA